MEIIQSNPFKNQSQTFVYTRTYSRWIEELTRRETWGETVDRYIDFIKKHRGNQIPEKVLRKIRGRLISLEVMPSMRALWAAGEAAEQDNLTMYNCSFASVVALLNFIETLYILMCGTGAGFRVSKKDADALPEVPTIGFDLGPIHVVEDSRKGWADATKELLFSLYAGRDIPMDYSKVRPKGSRLKTMGGRASGPEPLILLHNFLRETLRAAQNRKLTTLEMHDIQNQVAEIVVVGGVRRSSEISLSDLDDELMRNAKVGSYPLRRAMANNSAIYLKKPSAVDFLKEWASLAASGTGERGIFNLEGAKKRSPKRRKSELLHGVNPCSEILLRDKGLCNLSEVVVRPDDDLDDLLDKVETATWIGVIQSTFTYFPYLSEEWKKNCEEERLLGVSLTGQMDHPSLMTKDNLIALKKKALKVAKHASEIMGINMPAAITCTKPSGTVSQVVNSSSGIHPRHAPFYIRRYRISSTDPLFRLVRDQGVPISPENGQRKSDWAKAEKGVLDACSIYKAGEKWSEDLVNTWVISFPIKSPENSVVRSQVTAIEQLEHYKLVQTYWCEHNASATIYVKDHEWFEVGNWVYENWDYITGVSFLPYDGGKYEQAPYEDINEARYEELVKEMPIIDFSKLGHYETEDMTIGSKEMACSGGSCELP